MLSSSREFTANENGTPLFVNGRFNFRGLRTNTTLRYDDWKALDAELVRVARQELNGIADLNSGGLVKNLGSIGVLSSEYEQASSMTAASVDMDGMSEDNEDGLTFSLVAVPVPVTHKSFRLNLRMLEATRNAGSDVDVEGVSLATTIVAEGLEEILFNGATGIVINGSPVYGYTTHPNTNTASGSDWGTATNVYSSVLTILAAAEADNMRGPFNLYVATTQYGQARGDLNDGSGQNAMQRVLQNLPQIQAIKRCNNLTAGTAVLVQMTRDVVDLAKAIDPTVIEWETKGGLSNHFKVWAIQVPRVKATASGQSGVVLASGI